MATDTLTLCASCRHNERRRLSLLRLAAEVTAPPTSMEVSSVDFDHTVTPKTERATQPVRALWCVWWIVWCVVCAESVVYLVCSVRCCGVSCCGVWCLCAARCVLRVVLMVALFSTLCLNLCCSHPVRSPNLGGCTTGRNKRKRRRFRNQSSKIAATARTSNNAVFIPPCQHQPC